MHELSRVRQLLMDMGLNTYQASALAHLLLVGETKATTLSKISGVPGARIYGVLDKLSKMGLVTTRPGRPALYRPRPPQEIASSLISSNVNELKRRLRVLEDHAKDFTEISKKVYLKGKRGVSTIPLLRIVSVGEVSLEETKEIYNAAEEEILILSRAMEYLPEVALNLKKALAKGALVRMILMEPELLGPDDREKQAGVLEEIGKELGSEAELRFSEEIPIRGCVIDPEGRGRALFLVEDPGVPFFLREAAITSHPSVVKGLALMFNLMWKHRSNP